MSDTIRPIGFLLHDVARLLRRRFDSRAQKSGLTRAQWHVLGILKHHEGLNQSSLAELMDMEPITLSRHIDRLETAGWVDRRPDPADRRAHRLYVGAKVLPLLEEMRPIAAKVFAEALSGISDEEADLFVDVLSRMRANLVGKGDPSCAVTTALLQAETIKETAS